MVYKIRTDGMAFVNGPVMAFDSTVFMDYETRTDEMKLLNGAEFRPQYCSTRFLFIYIHVHIIRNIYFFSPHIVRYTMYMSPCYRENIPTVFYRLVLHLTVSNARLINMHFSLRLGLRYIHFDKNKISTCGIIDIFCTSVFGIEKNLERCSDVLGHLLISCTDFVLFFT